ncbi:MAG: 2-oxoglutarate dehydrogenase complex dihydrolipoyllysine-residue succinyltransferase, partial [Chloroflexi bacterium]|nr:2-oxoglutarate dehydrogenase complex dihydrolipoyllysine-residue succinyltransferase [Chloroflexota bacterium]
MPGSPVRVPTLGESVVEATVGPWLKREGEHVEAGEALVQLETEKVNVDVAADRAGVVGRIEHAEGDTVHPGDVLATLEAAAGGNGPPAADVPPAQASVAPPTPTDEPTEPDPTSSTAGPAPAPGPDDGEYERPHASPVARRMAEEHGLNLADVAGTGTGGRVTREDVERAIGASSARVAPAQAADARAASAASGPAADARGEERVRMTRRRQTIAQRLLEAQRTAAILTTFNEIDLSRLIELRNRRRDAFKERHGVSLGYMSFFTKAVVAALKAFPLVNAELRGDEIVLKHYYDIGIAVGAEGGLVVPVVRDADRKTFAEIEREIAELAARAQANTLTLDDLRGGTFTITNGGIFGSLMSTPILNTPQVGILGMHKIQERPVVKNGEIVIRPMMYVALSYDHRIVDGSEAVRFLVKIKEL